MRTRFSHIAAVAVLLFVAAARAGAQQNEHHLQLGASVLYERGLDATVAYQHTGKYHNAWEVFGTFYVKWDTDPDAGHVTKKSFWHSYNSWNVGFAVKPCMVRRRNAHGNLVIGASGGSDLDKFIGGIHLGYEHSFALKRGWELFVKVKEDVVIGGEDLFRTGIGMGIKVPLGYY